MRANFTKLMILLKSSVNTIIAGAIAAVFTWRNYGIVDLFSYAMSYHRYLCILVLARVFVWTVAHTSALISLLPETQRSLKHPKVRKLIKVQTMTAVLGAAFMMLLGVGNAFPQWTSRRYELPDARIKSSSEKLTDKMLLVATYLLCDYLSSCLADTCFHKARGFKVFLKNCRIKFLPYSVLWLWFACVIGIAGVNSSVEISPIVKIITLGCLLPFFKVGVVYLSKLAAEITSIQFNANEENTAVMVTMWVGSAEVCMNLASMYAIFLSCRSYSLFLFQFVPQEVIEQVTAFLSHHPRVIETNMRVHRKIEKLFLRKKSPAGGKNGNSSEMIDSPASSKPPAALSFTVANEVIGSISSN
jgi:hypothetical protein